MSERNAGHLLYPLRLLDDELWRYLRTRRVKPGDPRGDLIANTISPALRRCTDLARSMTPFDPSGL